MSMKGADVQHLHAQSIRQVILASFIGTTIEWHDFFLSGTAAALVAMYVMVMALITVVSTLLAAETLQSNVSEEPAH